MELGLWGTLWANCALGTTFFALPTLPILNTGTEDTLEADDDSKRQDHETQTTGLNFSDSDNSTQEQPDELDTETTEVQNNCSSNSDSNSVHSIPETTATEILIETVEKEKKTIKKKTKSFQRNRYSREEYRCTICPYTCTTERAFLRHLRSHSEGEDNEEAQGKQSPGIPRLSCPVCGKDRSGESALNKHMLRHRDQDKNFCCDICSFKTVQLKKLIQHRRMHTGERPHLCPHCVYRAARRDNLRSHVRRVHKRENLTCDTFSPRGMLLVPSSVKATSSTTTTDE